GIARPDVLALLVLHRVRKSSVQIEHRRNDELVRSRELAPEQKSIRRVERQPATVVRLNYHLLRVPEKLVEVVEIAPCLRVHIGRVHVVLAELIPAGYLKFAVSTPAVVCQFEHGSLGQSLRSDDEVTAGIALLIADADHKTFKNLP